MARTTDVIKLRDDSTSRIRRRCLPVMPAGGAFHAGNSVGSS